MALTIVTTIPKVSLSGNPMNLTINTDNLFDNAVRRPFYTIIVNIYNLANELIGSQSLEPNNDGYAIFDLSESLTVQPTLTNPISESTPVVADSTACLPFYFKTAEGYGIPYVQQDESAASNTFYVIPGGLSDNYIKDLEDNSTTFYDQLVLQNIWLTNQPVSKRVLPLQPEQLRFVNISETQITVSLMVDRLFADTTTETVQLWTGNMEPLTVYSILATPEFAASTSIKYSLYLVSNTIDISGKQSFEVENYKPENTRFVIFQNSLGGFDCVALTGKMVNEFETQSVSFLTPEITNLRNTLTIGQERALGIKYLTGSIGWKTNDEIEWLVELLLSEAKYLVNGNKLDTITIAADRRKLTTDESSPKTFNIEAVVGNQGFFF